MGVEKASDGIRPNPVAKPTEEEVRRLVEAGKQLLDYGCEIHPMALCHTDSQLAANRGCVVCELRQALAPWRK